MDKYNLPTPKKDNLFAKTYLKIAAVLMVLLAVSVVSVRMFIKQTPKGSTEAAQTEAANISFSPATGTLPPDIPVSVAIDAKSNDLIFARVVIEFDPAKVQVVAEAEISALFGTVIEKTTLAEANVNGKLIVVAGVAPPEAPASGVIENFITFTLTAISTAPNDTAVLSFETADMQFVNSTPVSQVPLIADSATYTINPVATETPTPTPSPTSTPTPTPTIAPTSTPTPSGDTQVPMVNVTNPLNGAIVPRGATYAFQASASDNVGVTKVEFYISGKKRCTDLAVPYECQWTTPAGSNNTFPIQARAYDAANNVGTHQITATTSN